MPKQVFDRKFNDAMYWVVDKKRPIQTVQDQLKNIDDSMDVFLKETQRPKRSAARIKDFWDKSVSPLIQKTAEHNRTVDELELYAHAMHAREANETLRNANSKMQVEKLASSW